MKEIDWNEKNARSYAIRAARVEDAEAIARVHVISWQSAYKGIMLQKSLDQLSIERRTEDWIQRLQPSDQLTFVLEIDGRVQGWASIGPCRDEDTKEGSGELYGIYLDPSCFGKGFGHPLYLHSENAMRCSGFKEARLWVIEANSRARHFYERIGYRPDGHTKSIHKEAAVLEEMRYTKNI